ncbi:cysteine dioxygenase type 1-like [Littorina saxatilis]|uniref:Cysteine dioxygenase n=1 Tax=Littorina saxatilis TaxID=31220 RepID=A0AAN9ALI1_9CAEN
MYEWPDHLLAAHEQTGRTDIPADDAQFGQMKMRDDHCYGRDKCTYICDDIGLHRVENPSHTDKSVTLHLYSPPFDECLCFDERTGRPITSQVTFWSKFGKRTPFGKDPKLVSAGEKENN